jgi:TATA-binding protein-associated factor Taf7
MSDRTHTQIYTLSDAAAADDDDDDEEEEEEEDKDHDNHDDDAKMNSLMHELIRLGVNYCTPTSRSKRR